MPTRYVRHIVRSRTIALAVSLAAVAAVAGSAGAASRLPDPRPAWGYEGKLLGVAADGTTYLGTRDLVAEVGSTPVVRLAGGGTDASWPDVARASVAAADGHGGFYAAGGVGDLESAAVVQHVLSSRTLDGRFKARFDRTPVALVSIGGLVLVSGPFTTVNGQARAGLAALDATTGAVAPWNPAPDQLVWTLADGGDGTVFAGGRFTRIAGVPRNGLAQLSVASGAATAWNPAPAVTSGEVMTLAVSPATVIVGGGFLWFPPKRALSKLVAVDRATGALATLGPTDGVGEFLGQDIDSVALLGSTVYAAGHFEDLGGARRPGIAAFDLASGKLLPWAPADDGGATAVVAGPSGVLVSGDHVRLLDPSTAAALPFAAVARGGPLVPLGDEVLVIHTDHQVGMGEFGGLAAIGTDGRPVAAFRAPSSLTYLRVLRAGPGVYAFACPERGCRGGLAGISAAMLRLDPATGARSGWRARVGWPSRVPHSYDWGFGDAVADARTLDVLLLFFQPGSNVPAASAIESFDLASGRRLGLAVQLPGGAPAPALALVRNGPSLVAGGIADERGRALARFDPRSLRPRGWPGAPRVLLANGRPGGVDRLAAAGGRVYLYGTFATVGGKARPARLAAISAGGERPAVLAALRQERDRREPGCVPGVRGRDRQPGREGRVRDERRLPARPGQRPPAALGRPPDAGRPGARRGRRAGGGHRGARQRALPWIARELFAVLRR